MDKIKFFPENLDVQNKKLILRLDLNVPLKDKVIQDKIEVMFNIISMPGVLDR